MFYTGFIIIITLIIIFVIDNVEPNDRQTIIFVIIIFIIINFNISIICLGYLCNRQPTNRYIYYDFIIITLIRQI